MLEVSRSGEFRREFPREFFPRLSFLSSMSSTDLVLELAAGNVLTGVVEVADCFRSGVPLGLEIGGVELKMRLLRWLRSFTEGKLDFNFD